MTIELPPAVEAELRTLAEKQGRDVLAVIEDAVQQYLESTAITDLDLSDVAATQLAVVAELSELPDWDDNPS